MKRAPQVLAGRVLSDSSHFVSIQISETLLMISPRQLRHAARAIAALSALLLANLATSAAARSIDAATFGALGDGKADDTAALQRALDSLQSGDILVIPAGKTYRHSDVLTIHNAGAHLRGPGTLLATDEAKSALSVEADNVIIDGGLELKINQTTRRWDAPAQNKLNLLGHSGAIVRGISIDGAAAAGLFVFGAANYLIEDVTVENTRADGIHNTHGAHHGIIRRAHVRNVGDDGIAVVSYGQDKEWCHDIEIESPRFYGNLWGRGFTVVGGEDITWRDIYAENSNAAALYISVEGEPWNTHPTKRVKVLGGELKNSNLSATVDHGAVLIYNARPNYAIEDVTIENLKIVATNPKASRQVGILIGKSGGVKNIALNNLAISGGPDNLFVSDAPKENFKASDWTFNGVAKPIGN